MYTEASYFGERRLFGLYRPPSPGVVARRHLIVICNAVFHEYFKTQFVGRQISKELAAIGYDVMRFDYSGQGNSEGELSRFSWQDDAQEAIDEGIALSGALNVSLIGFRFGGVMAAGYSGRLRSLVLWDPANGRVFLDHLRKVHHRLVDAHRNLSDEDRENAHNDELVGYRVSQEMLEDLQNAEIEWDSVTASRAYIIRSEEAMNQQTNGFTGELSLIDEPFECQWDLPSSRLLFTHRVVKRMIEIFQ